jgi:hypothetical protein
VSATYSKQRIPAYSWDGDVVAELEIIADVDAIGGYEWDRFAVYRDPATGLLYTAEGSGCSCNSLEEDWRTLADLGEPLDLHQAAEKAKAWERAEGDDSWNRDRRQGLGARVVDALLAMERATEAEPPGDRCPRCGAAATSTQSSAPGAGDITHPACSEGCGWEGHP